MLTLEMAVDDALFRIRREYDRTEGNIYLSFSGGKDSTVLAHLIKMANLPTQIPFVFANTGIELDAITSFVKDFPYDNIVWVKPRKPFGQILKEYGKPSISKLKSELLSTYQNNRHDPFNTYRVRQLITAEAERGGEKLGFRTRAALAKKHFNFLHPSQEYNVSNKCCTFMKKYPFLDFEKQNGMLGSFSGIRTAEGGVRGIMYKNCVMVKKKNQKDFYFSMPIIDWSDEIVNEFLEKYNIEISKAYTDYGMDRTGCFVCPFGKNIASDLKVLNEKEPMKYKAALFWLSDVYMDMEIELDFDEKYSQDYRERNQIVQDRRNEMWEKFKDVRFTQSKVDTEFSEELQLDIFDFIKELA